MSVRVRHGLIGGALALGALSLLLSVVLSGVSDRLGDPASAGSDSFSYSLIGHRAFATFLERVGLRVTRHRASHPIRLEPRAAWVEAEPLADLDSARAAPHVLEQLALLADSGAVTVLVLPKWGGQADLRRADWLRSLWLLPLPRAQAVLRRHALMADSVVRGGSDSLRCDTRSGASVRIVRAHAQWLLARDGLTPLVWHDSLVAVGRCEVALPESLGAGLAQILIIADPDLISNRGLVRGDHAELVHSLFRDELGVRHVVFDETEHLAPLQASIAHELVRFPLVLVFVQFWVLAGLVAWGSGRRVGAPRPASPAGMDRLALVHTTADLLAGAGDPAVTLSLYWDQVLQDVLVRFDLTGRTMWSERVARLAELERAQARPATVRALADELEALLRAERPAIAGLLRLARRIHTWHGEMLHERRTYR